MICIVAGWALIFLVTSAIGQTILRMLDASSVFDDPWDRQITAVWLGLGATAIFCLAFAVFGPVTPAAAGVLLLVAFYTGRGKFRELWRGHSPLTTICYAALIAGLALHAAITPVDAFDTGLYHQQAVSWLSQFGLVRGAAWFHFRLGFNTAWFALAAALNHGFLAGRISPLLGGFVTALCSVHLAAKCVRFLSGEWRPADYYLLVSYPVVLALTFFWHFDLSLSPDLPTWVITILVVWTGFLIKDQPDNSRARYLPLLLASFGACFKFSLLPLLPAAGLFIVRRIGLREFRPITAALCSMPVLVAVVANLLTSGCPLYPSPAGCTDFDWSVSTDFAESVSQGTTDWARWGADIQAGKSGKSWIPAWFRKRDRAGIFIFCAAGVLALIMIWRRERGWFPLWCLFTALAGLVFLALGAPNPRFGLGYFLLPPASALAIGLRRYQCSLRNPLPFALPLIVIAALLPIFYQDRYRSPDRLATLAIRHAVLPARVASTDGSPIHVFNQEFDQWTTLRARPDTIAGFRFFVPISSEQCWDYQPCSPSIVDRNFVLRDTRRGIAGGFRSARGTRAMRNSKGSRDGQD